VEERFREWSRNGIDTARGVNTPSKLAKGGDCSTDLVVLCVGGTVRDERGVSGRVKERRTGV
jgi:hypothetical protein